MADAENRNARGAAGSGGRYVLALKPRESAALKDSRETISALHRLYLGVADGMSTARVGTRRYSTGPPRRGGHFEYRRARTRAMDVPSASSETPFRWRPGRRYVFALHIGYNILVIAYWL